MSDTTAEGMQKLFERLDVDSNLAGEKYEELRLKLVKCFVWRKVSESHADTLADMTIDRVAKKLGEGVEIENINAYANEVSRYVFLEYTRKNKEDATDDEMMPIQAVEPEIPVEPNQRLECLRKCMREVADDEGRKLIIGYYDTEAGDKLKEIRKQLAEKLGIEMNYLKQKALRLRKKLEDCINDCVRETV